MKINSFYPVIGTKEVKKTTKFYMSHFDFTMTFESDWYISLSSKVGFQLAIIDFSHESVPQDFRQPTKGLTLNFEIENVDEKYGQIKAEGLHMHLDIRSEAWGQRHFIISDPNSILIDVIQIIEPSEEFKQMYKKGVDP